jgi:hypothetical protein
MAARLCWCNPDAVVASVPATRGAITVVGAGCICAVSTAPVMGVAVDAVLGDYHLWVWRRTAVAVRGGAVVAVEMSVEMHLNGLK